MFLRSWKLVDKWQLTSWRKFNVFEKLKDRHSRTIRETRCPPKEDPCCDPCPPPPPCPCPPPYPCPRPPPYQPDADPRKVMFWRILSLFVALPVVAIMSVITYKRVEEKSKQPREPFLNLPYMCRRTKSFPWGDGNHTLFHNPLKNPIPPHGYEVDDPNEIFSKKKNN